MKAQDALDQLATFARHDRDCAYSPAEYDHVGTQQVRERPCDCGMHEALSILRAALGASGAPGRDATSEAVIRNAALEEAALIADEHWPESGHVHPVEAVSCQMSISILIRRLKSKGASRGLPAPQEPELPLREINPEQVAKELEAALPALKIALAHIEEAKKVTRKALDFEITI